MENLSSRCSWQDLKVWALLTFWDTAGQELRLGKRSFYTGPDTEKAFPKYLKIFRLKFPQEHSQNLTILYVTGPACQEQPILYEVFSVENVTERSQCSFAPIKEKITTNSVSCNISCNMQVCVSFQHRTSLVKRTI